MYIYELLYTRIWKMSTAGLLSWRKKIPFAYKSKIPNWSLNDVDCPNDNFGIGVNFLEF